MHAHLTIGPRVMVWLSIVESVGKMAGGQPANNLVLCHAQTVGCHMQSHVNVFGL